MSLTSSLYSETIKLQKEIAKRVIAKDAFNSEIEHVCGIDVSYRNSTAYCSSAIIKKNTFELIESANTTSIIKYPYIPELFMLRESGPIMQNLVLLKNHFELLLIDGHGLLHPRKCGLACYIGVLTDKPTIGIAKSALCGSVRKDQYIELDGNIAGFKIKKQGKKQVYVSVGHRISLKTAIQFVKQLIKKEESIPEPLRIADVNSKNYFNFA
jgi:deoxyribonuclease V